MILFQTIGVDRKGTNIAMPDQLLSMACGIGVVKRAVGVHAFILILKERVSEHVFGVTVTVLPDQRNRAAVVACKSIASNRSAITAPEVILGRPAAKVVFTHRISFLEFESVRLLLPQSPDQKR